MALQNTVVAVLTQGTSHFVVTLDPARQHQCHTYITYRQQGCYKGMGIGS